MSLSGRLSTDESIVGRVGVLNTIEGKSAYEIALLNGFEGTEEEWLASLKGEKGDTYTLTEADKEEIADKVAVDNLQESAEKYIDSVIETKDLEVTRTATGSAITIESSQAPIPYLKLSGKTTKNGGTLTSTGDSGSFEVGIFGKNLFDHKNCLLKYAVTWATDNILSMTTTTDLTVDNNGYISGTTTKPTTLVTPILFIKGKTIYVKTSGFTPARPCIYYKKDGTVINAYGTGSYTPTETEMGYIGIGIHQGVTVNGYILVTYDNNLTLPQPCNEQQYLTITDTLRSVGDYKDEVDFARGVKIQRFKQSTFNGSEVWQYHETIGFYSLLGCKVYGQILTNLYPTNNGKTPIDKTASTNFGAGAYIWVKDTTYSDVDSFKSALATNPLTVVYEIEPIETPISETELNDYRHLMTNKPNTTILSEADMEVDYYINKPNAQAIGNIHSQVNKDYFKLQQAIISTGGSTL